MSTRRKWVDTVLVLVLMLVTGLLVVFVLAFLNYQRRVKTSKATRAIRQIFDASIGYYTSEFFSPGPDPVLLPRQFPVTVGLTPAAPLCRDGEPFTGPFDASAWDHPTWRALEFAPEGPLYFRYTYVSMGSGPDAHFTARALGDLDCDGVLSTFERVGPSVDDGYSSGHGAGLDIN